MDEISQVVELEAKGGYYLIKGSVTTIKYLVKAVVALAEWGQKTYKNRQGEVSWQNIKDTSKDSPLVFEIPKEGLELAVDENGNKIPDLTRFEQFCQNHRLSYAIMPDFNPVDGYMPIAVKSQDAAIFGECVNALLDEGIKTKKATESILDEKIKKAEEDIKNAPSREGREAARRELEDLKIAKAQNQKLLADEEGRLADNKPLTLEEYLAKGKGTDFEKNPKLALEKLEKGIEISKDLPLEEGLKIIRDPSLMTSIEMYYTQPVDGADMTIRREFYKDDRGLVYSQYYVLSQDGSQFNISDKGMTQEEWAKAKEELCKRAKMNLKEDARIDRNEASFLAYRNFNKPTEQDHIDKALSQKTEPTKEGKEFLEDNTQKKVQTLIFNKAQDTNEIKLEKDSMFVEGGVVKIDLNGMEVAVSSKDLSLDDDGYKFLCKNDKSYDVQIDGKKPVKATGNEISSKYVSLNEGNTRKAVKAKK